MNDLSPALIVVVVVVVSVDVVVVAVVAVVFVVVFIVTIVFVVRSIQIQKPSSSETTLFSAFIPSSFALCSLLTFSKQTEPLDCLIC